jgi:hypothetical protein
MTRKTRYVIVLSLLVTVVGIGTGFVAYYVGLPAVQFSSIGPAELEFVPRDSALVGYVNVTQVMASALRERVVQATQESAFQNHTGINVQTDIEYVICSLVANASVPTAGNSGMMLARGTFDEVKIESLMRDQGARLEQYKRKRLMIARDAPSIYIADQYAGQEFALSFFRPGLLALGNLALVRRAVDLETSGDGVTKNDELVRLIKSVNSSAAWAVGRFDALRASARVPQAINQLPAITWFSVSGRFTDGIDGVVRAETRDEASANDLRDVIRGLVALAKLQASSKPGLERLVQSLELAGNGKTVALSFQVPRDVLDGVSDAVLPTDNKPHGQ